MPTKNAKRKAYAYQRIALHFTLWIRPHEAPQKAAGYVSAIMPPAATPLGLEPAVVMEVGPASCRLEQ
jgi:hypothetical protein